MLPTVTPINDRKILWTDDFGTTHSCHRAEVVPGIFLSGPIVRTMCQQWSPDNRRHVHVTMYKTFAEMVDERLEF